MTTKLRPNSIQGLTLIESMVGMIILLSAAAGLFPLFTTYRLATISNDTKIGASAISQQILDTLRQTDIESLPSSGTMSVLPSGATTTVMNYKGKLYSATITYCETSSYCDSVSRHVKVKTYYGSTTSTPVFELETIYTKVQ